jgi:hypothetical protein
MKQKTLDISHSDIERLIEKIEQGKIDDVDHDVMTGALHLLLQLRDEIKKKSISIDKLKRILFGAKTESKKNFLCEKKQKEREVTKEKKSKAKGHGKKPADDYKNAEIISVKHENLQSGDVCPECTKGKVYPVKKPKVLIRFTSTAPFTASKYECEKLRCNTCLKLYVAQLPDGVADNKYDNTVKAMLPVLRYGGGVPHNRLEALQESMGHPFPDATQWDVLVDCYNSIKPLYEHLFYLAAQGSVIHNDDTNMKITSLIQIKKELYEKQKRTGIFTTGFISNVNENKIALFMTGKNHAGENMIQLLLQREKGLPPPIQMCDALTRNYPDKEKVILAHCLTHGRRNFSDLILLWPEKSEYVIKKIAMVYKNEKHCIENNFTPRDRLLYHQEHSRLIMDKLRVWFKRQFLKKEVEPNCDFGKAITYMLNHWTKLTLFLRKEGAPIDNNICERALKKAILHRKNSLFYKTMNGALVGDTFMSIIHTCNLLNTNPYEYLIVLLDHQKEIAQFPQKWLPWNYKENLLAEVA